MTVPILILCALLFLLNKADADKGRIFKDLIRPIVAGLLALSLVSPLTATAQNGFAAISMLILGIVLFRFCEFFKKYPPALLVIFGVIGAFLFS